MKLYLIYCAIFLVPSIILTGWLDKWEVKNITRWTTVDVLFFDSLFAITFWGVHSLIAGRF